MVDNSKIAFSDTNTDIGDEEQQNKEARSINYLNC